MRFITFLVFLSVIVSPLVAWGQGEESYIEVVPSILEYEDGEEIVVTVTVHALERATAFRAHLLYDVDSLAIKEIQNSTNDFPYWFEQEEDNGVVRLEASVPTPGYQGNAMVATIVFTALRSGSSAFVVGEGALLLNTQNENILLPQEESQPEIPVENTIVYEQDVSAPAAFNIGNGGIIIVALIVVAVAGGGILLWRRKSKQGV